LRKEEPIEFVKSTDPVNNIENDTTLTEVNELSYPKNFSNINTEGWKWSSDDAKTWNLLMSKPILSEDEITKMKILVSKHSKDPISYGFNLAFNLGARRARKGFSKKNFCEVGDMLKDEDGKSWKVTDTGENATNIKVEDESGIVKLVNKDSINWEERSFSSCDTKMYSKTPKRRKFSMKTFAVDTELSEDDLNKTVDELIKSYESKIAEAEINEDDQKVATLRMFLGNLKHLAMNY